MLSYPSFQGLAKAAVRRGYFGQMSKIPPQGFGHLMLLVRDVGCLLVISC
jgi:hypothetical protein